MYHKEFQAGAKVLAQLRDEVRSNAKLFAPVVTGFGQYPSVSHSREVIVIRTLTDAHHARKRVVSLDFEKSGVWQNQHLQFPETVKFANSLLSLYDATEIGKVIYAKIPPGGTINYHTDSFPLYSGFIRVHLPIYSERNASDFYSEEGNFSMEEGFVYLYDTKPMHTTKNNSSSDRTHLIVDLLVKDRDTYFKDPEFYYERVMFTSEMKERIESQEFKSVFSNLGTLLFFLSINEQKGTAFLLWNSKKSRDHFMESFEVYKELLESGNVHWKDSYKLVEKESENTSVNIVRKDYE